MPIMGAGRGSDDPASSQPATSIQETQITVRLGSKQFQATVVDKQGGMITIVTAAHCVSASEAGSAILMTQADRQLGGRLVRATQNPDYRPVTSRDAQSRTIRGVLCVDNAVATLELRPANAHELEALLKLKPAELTASTVPEGSSQTVTVHVFDQTGQEHVVKAGNHLNPKCLAWGHSSYHPVPGDSGAGVFLMRPGVDGKASPLLIGNLALSDNRGGIAPLLSRKIHWIDEALTIAAKPTKLDPGRPPPP
jgi:hypothetical protein